MAGGPQPMTEAPKASRGVDYSKFDKIEDSDDEKPSAAKATATKVVAEKPHCANCHKDIVKALRCGVCKKVSYCSAQCQKEDWQFHKRVCKGSEKAKETDDAPRKSDAPKTEAPKPKKKTEDKVIDDEDTENLTWYKHRDWKPTAEPKKEFTPEPIRVADGADAAGQDARPSRSKSEGSVWNAAGTWEEKDVTANARITLKEKLAEFPDVESSGGSIVLAAVDSVEGEASKPVIRAKMRHIFDFSFKVPFTFQWMDSSGRREAKGKIDISDFTNDTFTEGVLAAPEVRLSFPDGKLLDQGRRKSVEESLGTSSWPPASGTALDVVAQRMREWSIAFAEQR